MSKKKTIDLNHKTVLISQTGNIRSVILTLPLCAWIKKTFPASRILFLSDDSMKSIPESLPEIDETLAWQDLHAPDAVEILKSMHIDVCIHVFPRKEIASLVRKSKIPVRIGASQLGFHFLTCNVKVYFSSKNSIHESQLNFEFMKPFGLHVLPELEEMSDWVKSFKANEVELPANLVEDLRKSTKKIILHPKSIGNQLEWPIEKYAIVAQELLRQGHSVYYTGTEQDGIYIRQFIEKHENCRDTSGKLSIAQLICFISKCDVLVAGRTGPLYIAGILGLETVGLFPGKESNYTERWKALGKNVKIIFANGNLENSKVKPTMNSVEQIESGQVIDALLG